MRGMVITSQMQAEFCRNPDPLACVNGLHACSIIFDRVRQNSNSVEPAQEVRSAGTHEALSLKRLAVTEEQITRYALETAPQKGTDRRGDHKHATVQAEALNPTQLTDLVRAGVEEAVDLRALERVRARFERERQQLVRKAEGLVIHTDHAHYLERAARAGLVATHLLIIECGGVADLGGHLHLGLRVAARVGGSRGPLHEQG
ncbi:hypothetical protein [Streptomyces sp. NPDC094149]|uniref:hypothetical protein n=1 Tax=Streptomyces sp. NPDC094149 TaxID=3155079 RepID=UPI003328923D